MYKYEFRDRDRVFFKTTADTLDEALSHYNVNRDECDIRCFYMCAYVVQHRGASFMVTWFTI